jgi:hypothetical protein
MRGGGGWILRKKRNKLQNSTWLLPFWKQNNRNVNASTYIP